MTLLQLPPKEKIRHALIWLFILTYIFVTSPKTNNWFFEFIGCVLNILALAFVYYTMVSIAMPNLWHDKRIMIFPSLLTLFLIYFCFKWLIGDFMIHFAHIKSPPGRFRRYLRISGLFFSQVVVVAFSTYFNKLALEKMKLEHQRRMKILIQELDYLKRQFNSHLTYNFLNFVYGKVLNSSSRAAEAIGLFAENLRYSLGIQTGKRVPLAAEFEGISNFIELQKCLNKQCYVSLSKEGDFTHAFILPRVLISFIENVFLTGAPYSPEFPLLVSIVAKRDLILFSISGKIDDAMMSNFNLADNRTRVCLNMYYKDMHSIEIVEQSESSSIRMTLKNLREND